MIKNTFLWVLFALVSSTVFSQEKTFRIGPTVGVEAPFTVGNFELGDGSEPTSLLRGHGGIAFNISFSEKIGLQPEILYQSRVVEGSTSQTAYSNSYGYVLIPVLFDLKLASGFSLQAGPRIGLQVASDEFIANDSEVFLAGVPKTEIAVMFGPQYVTNIGLFFNLRAEYTFTSAYTTGNVNGGGVGVGLGWFF